MPKNVELIERANELAETTGQEIKTEGLNNAQLAALVKSLEAQEMSADTLEPAAPVAAPPVPVPAVPNSDPVDAHYSHVVAPGVTLTSKRGMLLSGVGVEADDLGGGAEAFAAQIEAGHIVKR